MYIGRSVFICGGKASVAQDEELAAALEGGAVKVFRDTTVPPMSNTRREQSAPPDANAEPSELKDTECTATVCPCNTATCLPLATSHRHTDPVSVPATSRLADHVVTTTEGSATQHRGEELPLKRRTVMDRDPGPGTGPWTRYALSRPRIP